MLQSLVHRDTMLRVKHQLRHEYRDVANDGRAIFVAKPNLIETKEEMFITHILPLTICSSLRSALNTWQDYIMLSATGCGKRKDAKDLAPEQAQRGGFSRTIRLNKSTAKGLASAGKYDFSSFGFESALDMMAFRAAGWVTKDSSSSGGSPSTETIVSN